MSTHECMLLIRMLKYQLNLSAGDLEIVADRAGQCLDHHSLMQELIDGGVIEPAWAERARTYLRSKSRSRVAEAEELCRMDRAFGRIALDRGWIDVGQLEAALLEQERLRRKSLHFRIGEVLVKSKSLEIDRVRTILREQGVDGRHCDQCESVVAVEIGTNERQSSCPSCGGGLQDLAFLDIVRCDL